MPDRQQQPIAPVPTQASANHTNTSGAAIPAPAPVQLQDGTAAQESSAMTPPANAAAVTPPPANITNLLVQRQPSAEEKPPFRLPSGQAAAPAQPAITPWHTVQRQAANPQPVVQLVQIRVEGKKTKTLKIDTTELYKHFKEKGYGHPYFNSSTYPRMQEALAAARDRAKRSGKQGELQQIEEMLIGVYGYEKEDLNSEEEHSSSDYDDNEDTYHARKKKKRNSTKYTGETVDLQLPDNLGSQQTTTQDQTDKMEAEVDMQSHSKPIGIVTWNVAHFSDKETIAPPEPESDPEDMEQEEGAKDKDTVAEITRLGFQERLQFILDKFRIVKAGWDDFCDEANAFITAINKYIGNDDLWLGVQDTDNTKERLAKVVNTAKGALDGSGGLFDQLTEYTELDWNAWYNEALVDNKKKVPLAQKTKAFRAFGREYVNELIWVLSAVTKIWGPDVKAATFLNNMTGHIEANNADDKKKKQRVVSIGLLKDKKAQMRSQLNRTEIEEVARALHTRNIALQVEQMFSNNSWLDIVILQEVNNPKLLEDPGSSYDMITGPEMSSGGKNPQKEYYPILLRKGSGFAVTDSFYMDTAGRKIPLGEAEKEDGKQGNEEPTTEKGKQQEVKWDKSQGIYRPIIVYELQRTVKESGKKETVWVGVVHTTPETDSGIAEFNRVNIFNEIKAGLQQLSNMSAAKGIPLIVGGDYYLTAEALVMEETRKRKRNEKLSEKEQEQLKKDQAAIREMHRATDTERKTLVDSQKAHRTLMNRLLEVQQLDKRLQNARKQLEGLEDKQSRKAVRLKRSITDTENDIALKLQPYKLKTVEELENYCAEQQLEQEERNKQLKMLTEVRKDKQILRNMHKNTTQEQVKAMGLTVTQSISGTNPKEDPLTDWSKLQIADFFIDKGWQTGKAGILRSEGKMVSTDAEDLRHSQYWQHFSDHFPVGGVFSSMPKDNETVMNFLEDAFVEDEKAEATAKQANINLFAFQYIRDMLRNVQQQKKIGRTDEERSDLMTAKAYLHKIRALEAKYDKLPKYKEGKLDKKAVMDYFKTLPSLIAAAIDPEAKITPPDYDDYATVYLNDLREDMPETPGLDAFKDNRIHFALQFLKQRLENLRKKSPESTVPERKEQEESPDPNVQWINIQWFIGQIQTLEQALPEDQLKPDEKLLVIRPEDIEPESIDPALAPKQKEPGKDKKPPPPRSGLTEEQEIGWQMFLDAAAAGQKVWHFLIEYQDKFYPVFRARQQQVLSAIQEQLSHLFTMDPGTVLDVLRLLTNAYGLAPAQLLQPAVPEAVMNLKLIHFAAAALKQLNLQQNALPLIRAVLQHLDPKQLEEFLEVLINIERETGVRPDELMIMQMLHLSRVNKELQNYVSIMIMKMRWADEEGIGFLLSLPAILPSKDPVFHGKSGDMQRAMEESLLTFGKQESFALSGQKVGLDAYMELHNADGQKHNCLIFSIARALGVAKTSEEITDIGKQIRKNKQQLPGALLDTGDIPEILKLLGVAGTIIVIGTSQNAEDPEKKGRKCFEIEIIDTGGKTIFLVNAGNLHFGYASVKPGCKHLVLNDRAMCFEGVANTDNDNLWGGKPMLTQEEIKAFALQNEGKQKQPDNTPYTMKDIYGYDPDELDDQNDLTDLNEQNDVDFTQDDEVMEGSDDGNGGGKALCHRY